MFPRSLFSSVSAALAVAACGGVAAAAPPISTTSAAAYKIDYSDQQVTVKDGSGAALLTCRAATPTVRVVLTRPAPGAARQLSLTVEDENGLRLWSSPVPVASPLSFNFKSVSKGMELDFYHSADATPDPKQPQPSRVSFALGADDRLVSMKVDDKELKFAIDQNHASIIGPDGKQLLTTTSSGQSGMTFVGPDGRTGHVGPTAAGLTAEGGTLDLNGTEVPVKRVERDGKTYYSFPWNGHNVLVQSGCEFTITDNGDLTVNAPAATAGK